MLPKMLAFERLKSSCRGFVALVILGKSLNKGLFRRFGAGSLVIIVIHRYQIPHEIIPCEKYECSTSVSCTDDASMSAPCITLVVVLVRLHPNLSSDLTNQCSGMSNNFPVHLDGSPWTQYDIWGNFELFQTSIGTIKTVWLRECV